MCWGWYGVFRVHFVVGKTVCWLKWHLHRRKTYYLSLCFVDMFIVACLVLPCSVCKYNVGHLKLKFRFLYRLMQIWTSKYGGFVSSIILNIEICCADILHEINGNLKKTYLIRLREMNTVHHHLYETKKISIPFHVTEGIHITQVYTLHRKKGNTHFTALQVR
jgi:hypothetical protein